MVVDKYEQYFKDHNRVKEFSGHSLKVHTVAWSADGKRLASGSLDKEWLFIGSLEQIGICHLETFSSQLKTACVFTLDKDRLVKGETKTKPMLGK